MRVNVSLAECTKAPCIVSLKQPWAGAWYSKSHLGVGLEPERWEQTGHRKGTPQSP